jgi:5-methylcytosine-specific restriction endonuclease McrA
MRHPAEERPMAFRYPRRRHVRRHGPRGYRNYRSYKPWLRDEFDFRCVYCLWRERWCADGDHAFSVDHLLPRTTHPERLCDYDNLVYACCQCNALKQDAPTVINPGVEPLGQYLERVA